MLHELTVQMYSSVVALGYEPHLFFWHFILHSLEKAVGCVAACGRAVLWLSRMLLGNVDRQFQMLSEMFPASGF